MNAAVFVHIAAYLVALAALTWGGNHVCRIFLRWSGLLPSDPATPSDPAVATADQSTAPVSSSQAGRWIGPLERLLIALGLIANSWEVLVAVVALKTVARYQELDKRSEAEYFLVGSLTSLLWAILVTLLTIYYDRAFGLHVFDAIFTLHNQPVSTPGN